QIQKILQSIAISLAGASVVLVAREYKSKNKEKAKKYATVTFAIALISSLIISLFLSIGAILPITRNIFFNDKYRAEGGWECYNLYLIVFVLMTINTVFLGLERSKNKNLFVLILNILIITFRIALAFLYKGIYGKEVTVIHLVMADILSNAVISILAMIYMFHPKNDFQLKFSKKYFLDKDIIKKTLKLSMTLAIGKTTYEIGKKIINDMTTEFHGKYLLSIAGFAAVVNGIFYSISQSLEDGQSTLVSQKASTENNSKTLKIFKNVFIITLIIGLIGIISNQYLGENLLTKILKPDKTFTSAEIKGFKEILFYEQMSLFTSVWASMMMIYIMSYKKNANIILLLNILRIVTRIFLLWFLHEFISINTINSALQFGLSTSLSNIIVLIVTVILFINFIKKQKKIDLKN
ncbi:MAG: MATE family efflux transporter, partial [Candidatus Phytoplasma stylosanthis]|nr:MATE family efflux transporter [Candidatus Phytoplasma stylosanthis]